MLQFCFTFFLIQAKNPYLLPKALAITQKCFKKHICAKKFLISNFLFCSFYFNLSHQNLWKKACVFNITLQFIDILLPQPCLAALEFCTNAIEHHFELIDYNDLIKYVELCKNALLLSFDPEINNASCISFLNVLEFFDLIYNFYSILVDKSILMIIKSNQQLLLKDNDFSYLPKL